MLQILWKRITLSYFLFTHIIILLTNVFWLSIETFIVTTLDWIIIDLLVSISLFIFNTFSQEKENHLFLSLLKAWTTSLTSSVSKIFFSRCISLSSSPFFSFISSYLCLALSSSKHYKTFCSFSLKFLGLCSLSLWFMFFSRTEVIFE
jgi:hypothetical protein